MNCYLISEHTYSPPSQIILLEAKNWVSQLKSHSTSQKKLWVSQRSWMEEGFRLL